MCPADQRDVSERSAGTALFVVSCLLLLLELAQVRLFSYSLSPKIVYAAIAITLLGLGASGTLMAMSTRLLRSDPRRLVAICATAFAIAVPLTHWLFAVGIEPRRATELGEYPTLILLLAGLIVPQFLIGMIIARLLSGPPSQVPRRYFANLLGSSVGCLLFIPLLPWLGLERLILGVALAGALVGVGFAAARQRRMALGVAILALIAVIAAPAVLDFPARYGQLQVLRSIVEQAQTSQSPDMARVAAGLSVEREYSRWDPIGKIEIHSLGDNRVFIPDPVESRFFSQDGSAASILIPLPLDRAGGAPFFQGTVYGLSYIRGRPDSVLVIGLGGAPDILSALYYGAGAVIGVEINRGAIEAIEGPMADFLDAPYARPEVQIVCADGRGFLRRVQQRFDVIQLTGVDTGTALAPGSNVLAENYLYTREALGDLLRALRPDGIASILRFGDDPLRLGLLAAEALRELGAEHPGNHLMVIGQGYWQNLLIKRSPFTDEDLRLFDERLQIANQLPRVRIPMYEVMAFGLNAPLEYIYHPQRFDPDSDSYMNEFWLAVRAGREGEIFDNLPRLLRSVTDDRPFFFFKYFGELKPLLLFLIELGVVAVVLILLPLLRYGRRGMVEGSRATLASTILYFMLLGAGYLIVEVALMQRFALFLGHPSYSISVTLFALLLSSSLGAMLAARLPAGPTLIRWSLAGVVLLVLLLALDVHAALLESMTGTGLLTRSIIVALLIAPLGLLMGIPFPVGLSLVGRELPGMIPWAIGINGLASVLAAVGNTPFAMLLGFRAVLIIGGGIYLIAWAVTQLGALAPPQVTVPTGDPIDSPPAPAA